VGMAAAATADSGKDIGQACGTNDLTFTVSEETQAGGYLLVTAKALPGITCYLEGVYPSASFGSSADTEVSPAEHSVTETGTEPYRLAPTQARRKTRAAA